MIDLDFIEMKIYRQEDSRKIQVGDHLSTELIELLKEGKIPDRQACFAPSNGGVYLVDVMCADCNRVKTKELTKTKTLDYLRGAQIFLCDECTDKRAIAEREEEEKSRKEFLQAVHDRTIDYIKYILDPNRMWNKGLSQREKNNLVIYAHIDSELVAEHIKKMGYY